MQDNGRVHCCYWVAEQGTFGKSVEPERKYRIGGVGKVQHREEERNNATKETLKKKETLNLSQGVGATTLRSRRRMGKKKLLQKRDSGGKEYRTPGRGKRKGPEKKLNSPGGEQCKI